MLPLCKKVEAILYYLPNKKKSYSLSLAVVKITQIPSLFRLVLRRLRGSWHANPAMFHFRPGVADQQRSGLHTTQLLEHIPSHTHPHLAGALVTTATLCDGGWRCYDVSGHRVQSVTSTYAATLGAPPAPPAPALMYRIQTVP